MRAQLGTHVRSRDDKPLGDVEWVLIDPDSKMVRSIGVRHGLIREHTIRIPLGQIHVSPSLDHLVADIDEELTKHLAHPAPSHVESMPDGAAVAASTGGGVWPPETFATTQPRSLMERAHLGAARIIETDVIGLAHGSDVFTKDAQHIGTLEQLRFETRTGQLLSVVVKRGIFHHEEFELGGEFIAGVDEGSVYLNLDRDAVKRHIVEAV